MSYSVTIQWGGASTRDEVYRGPEDGDIYTFPTKVERDAFLLGADKANGWIDYIIIEETESP